jgi:hypothetical protein
VRLHTDEAPREALDTAAQSAEPVRAESHDARFTGGAPPPGARLTPDALLSLQRSAGNGAVAALLAKRRAIADRATQYLARMGEEEEEASDSAAEGKQTAAPGGASEGPPAEGADAGTGGEALGGAETASGDAGPGGDASGDGGGTGEDASTGLRGMLDALSTVRSMMLPPPAPPGAPAQADMGALGTQLAHATGAPASSKPGGLVDGLAGLAGLVTRSRPADLATSTAPGPTTPPGAPAPGAPGTAAVGAGGPNALAGIPTRPSHTPAAPDTTAAGGPNRLAGIPTRPSHTPTTPPTPTAFGETTHIPVRPSHTPTPPMSATATAGTGTTPAAGPTTSPPPGVIGLSNLPVVPTVEPQPAGTDGPEPPPPPPPVHKAPPEPAPHSAPANPDATKAVQPPKPAAKKGGGAPRGGGGPPKPKIGDPSLSKWKAATSTAVGGVQQPDMSDVKAGAEKLKTTADDQDAKRKAEKKDYGEDAKAAVTPAPEPEEPEPFDTTPAKDAVREVESVGEYRLPNQQLPQTKPPPPEITAIANSPLAAPKPMPPDTRPADPTKATEEQKVRMDPAADAMAQKLADIEKVPKPGEAAPITFEDKGPASLKPLSPEKADAVGDVIARMIAQADQHAKRISAGAKGKLAGGKPISALESLAKEDEGPLKDEIVTELKGIGKAAGATEDELNAKVAEIEKATKKEGEQATEDVKQAADTGKAKVETRSGEESSEIAGASETVKEEIEAKEITAQGSPDPEMVDATRDEFLGKVESVVAAGTSRLKAVAEKRSQDIDTAAQAQKAHYQTEGNRLRDAMRRYYDKGDAESRTQAMVESRKATDWADARIKEVDDKAAQLKDEANELVKQATSRLREAGDTAREKIRDWAAASQGKQRSWWDRLWDMIKDWGSQAKADNSAWEEQRNAESRDAIVSDMQLLTDVRTAIDTGNQAAIEEKLKGLDATQRELVMAYIKGGGQNGIGFVGMMAVGRLVSRRVPELVTKWEDRAVAEWGWLDLNLLAAARNQGFNASTLGNQVHAAVAVAGTDEDKLFNALGQARTKVERAALEKFYLETFKTSIQSDVKSDTEGFFGDSEEWDRAKALLEGKGDEADATAIHDAISGIGTDEKAINDALRGKSDAERRAIMKAYKEKYGVDLKADLAGDMEDAELDIATALLEGNEAAATAAEIEAAMEGAGTDEAAITKAYERIREEVEAKARAKGMSAAEVQAEVERRNAEVRKVFNEKYGKNWTGEGEDALAKAMGEELGGAEHELGKALAAADQTEIDAAKARVEHESFYTDDKKIEDLLRNQHKRAKTEVTLDNAAEEKYLKDQVGAGNITEEQYKNQKAALDEKKKKADEEIKKKAQGYMGDLAKAYDNEKYVSYDENGQPIKGKSGDFENLLKYEVGGGLFGDRNDEKVQKLYKNAGTMSPEDEIYYATTGAGTDEDRIKETLKGKTKAEIKAIRDAYNEAHKNDVPPGDFDNDILGDLAGRDDFDVRQLLKGKPETPEEALQRAREAAAYERESGFFGTFFGDSTNLDAQTEAMATQLATFKDLEARKRAGEKLTPEEEAQLAEAQAAFDILKVGQEEAVTQHRAIVDDVTDMAAQVGAAVVGLAVTVLTGGGAAPLLAAGWAAAAGAAAATAASIGIKAVLKGQAYSYEDAMIEAGVGVVDATAQYFTAGLSNALKAMSFMKTLAGKGLTGKALEFAVREGIQGAISGIPAAAAGAMSDENLWHGDDPFQAFMDAVGTGMAMGAVMGVGMGGAMEGAEFALGKAGVKLEWGGLGKKPVEPGGAGAGAGKGGTPDVKPAPIDVPPDADVDTSLKNAQEGKLPNGSPVPDEGKGPALGGDEVPPSPLKDVPVGKDESVAVPKDEKVGGPKEEKPGGAKDESLGESKKKLEAGAEEPPAEVKELLDALDSAQPAGKKLTDKELGEKMGIPEDAAKKMRLFCESYGVILDVRPSNVDGLELLAKKLGLPKPEILKNKTIDGVDVKLGIDPKHKGKVGIVNPADMKLPDDFFDMPPADRAEIINRIEQRQKEWNEWQNDKKVQALIKDGIISVKDGVVYAGTGADAKPFVGDHDIFNIRRADGKPMTPSEYQYYITQMRFWGMNVEHGAHLEWDPKTKKYKQMKKDIIDKHSPGGDKPLVRFGPDGTAETAWHTGPDTIEFAPETGQFTPGGKLGEDMSKGPKRPETPPPDFPELKPYGDDIHDPARALTPEEQRMLDEWEWMNKPPPAEGDGAPPSRTTDEDVPPVPPKEPPPPEPKPFEDQFQERLEGEGTSQDPWPSQQAHKGDAMAMPFDPEAPPHADLKDLVIDGKPHATKSPSEANQLFQQAIRADPDTEYGVWYDVGTKSVVVNRGTAKGTMQPDGKGPFILLAHNHPGRAGQGTSKFFEPIVPGSKAARGDVVPSAKDVSALLENVQSLGAGVEAKIPVAGEFTVTYSFDPATKQLVVTGPYGTNGAYASLPFKSIKEYADWVADFTGKPKPTSIDPSFDKMWEQAGNAAVTGPKAPEGGGSKAETMGEDDWDVPTNPNMTAPPKELGTAPEPGKTYSGKTVAEPLGNIASASDATALLTSKWGTRPGRDPIKFDFDGAEQAMAEALARKLDQLFQAFPGMVHRINTVEIGVLPAGVGGEAGAKDLSIKLNEKTNTVLAAAEAKGKEGKASQWLSTDDAVHTLVHEFGHHLTYAGETAIFYEGGDIAGALRKGMYGQSEAALKQRLEQALTRLGAPPAHEGYNRELWMAENLSQYAAKDVYEAFAEAFAEYQIKGPDSRPLARELGEWLAEEGRKVPH